MEDYQKTNIIPIAYSCNNLHSKLALVSMTSIMENTNANIEFIILYSDLSEETLQNLSSIEKYKNCKITFNKIDKSRFEGYENVSWVTVEGWYRILLPELFPQYDKLVYLDCDTLVNGDISEFYNKDISNVLVGVVKDVWGIDQAAKRTNLKDKAYFNSGVLLINSKKWRDSQIYTEIDKYVHHNDYKYGDQDVLNYVISDDKLMLSPRYNYLEGWWGNYKNDYEGEEAKEYEEAKTNPLIIHFTGYKPDTIDSHHSMKELWWKYAMKTCCYDEEQKKKNLKELYTVPPLNYDGTIPLCYITNENNAVYTLTSLISILENTKNPITAIIVDNGLTEKTKEKFTSLNYEKFNIRFTNINNDEIPDKLPILDYFVFNIGNFISDFDKVIYLKNSTLLNGDIQELFNYDISKVFAAVVQDVWYRASANRIQLGNNDYFSCGVMLLNTENIKKSDLLGKAVEYAQNTPNTSEQDILNKIINEDKILISPKYNYMEPWWTEHDSEYKYYFLKEYEKAKTNPLIVHFTGYMPDDAKSRHSFGSTWWNYLKKTDYYIQKLEKFRLNFYDEKISIGNSVAKYRNKLREIYEKASI